MKTSASANAFPSRSSWPGELLGQPDPVADQPWCSVPHGPGVTGGAYLGVGDLVVEESGAPDTAAAVARFGAELRNARTHTLIADDVQDLALGD